VSAAAGPYTAGYGKSPSSGGGQSAPAPQDMHQAAPDSDAFQITQQTVPSGLRLIPQGILKLFHLVP
jgi:hypothetical protein